MTGHRGHRVLIIGCGAIAGGYDAADDSAGIFSHAGAFTKHGGFELAACIEPDHEKRVSFADRWNVAFNAPKLDDLPQGLAFDVISICSPTDLHFQHARWAIERRPKLIFSEKPITAALDEAREIVATCESEEILLAVNHLRRWDPEIIAFKTQLAEGFWGSIRSVQAIYNKGILNNGTHLVDIIAYLLGEDLNVLAAGKPKFDFWKADPSVTAILESDSGVPVTLAIADASDFSLFEFSIATEEGLISIEDGGARWSIRRRQASPRFSGYRSLDSHEFAAGGLGKAMLAAVGNIDDALRTGQALVSTGVTALRAQELCDTVRNLACG